MFKLIKKLIKKLEQFEKMSDQEQVVRLIKLKKRFPQLSVWIEQEEIK
ncbi:hypothetical protein I4Q36_09280 [Tuanshanicoccus lijuaniae]|nr:hypothetical protein [Aerococcaceae bacterium zg-1292]MBF6979311.1 hypothetical protein [Aerococcaceae bacterium zg-BR22]MBS4456971.1 hypothetical protein [Aerococcaceae bacterium zg-A91]MBS4458810.1 hypothetical protein [Aerococcaceae bacterium zg-BR33]QQA36969.1 hypothetical protein I4Q36_09280 [Aerococcaceae bacterium zg-1292]